MKKIFAGIAAIMMMAATAHAGVQTFGHFKYDPAAGLQKMGVVEWYPSMKPMFFGDKPNAGIMFNNKNSNIPFLQLGFNNTSKGMILTPASMFGMTVDESDPESDEIFLGIVYSESVSAFFGCEATGCKLDSDGAMELKSQDSTLTVQSKGNMTITSEDGNITVTPDAAGNFRVAGETLIDEVNIFTLTQEDVGATCTLGQIRIDNGGAAEELCYCKATDTWVCAALTSGPAD